MPENGERPYEPEFRAAQRGRLILEYVERGERHHAADKGWIKLDGPWVHFYGDDDGLDHWQTWPASSVVYIDWDTIPVPPF